eukprot:Rmarinus@m.624
MLLIYPKMSRSLIFSALCYFLLLSDSVFCSLTEIPTSAEVHTVSSQENTFSTCEGCRGVLLDESFFASNSRAREGSDTFTITNIPRGWKFGFLASEEGSSRESDYSIDGGFDGVGGEVPYVSDGDSDVDFTLTLRAPWYREGMATKGVEVVAVADVPSIVSHDVSSAEDLVFHFMATPTLGSDTDGSEVLPVLIVHELPGLASFRGTPASDSSIDMSRYTLASVDSRGFRNGTALRLSLTPTEDCDVNFSLTVTVVSEESNGSDRAFGTTAATVNLEASADTPALRVKDGGTETLEDTGVALPATPEGSRDTDGSELLRLLALSGLPTRLNLDGGASVRSSVDTETAYSGNEFTVTARGNGFSSNEVVPLTITPVRHCDVDFSFALTLFAVENNGNDRASSSSEVQVRVAGVVDEMVKVYWNKNQDEDKSFALAVTPMSPDSDGSESVRGIRVYHSGTDVDLVTYTSVTSSVSSVVGATYELTLTGDWGYDVGSRVWGVSLSPPVQCDNDFTLYGYLLSVESNGVEPMSEFGYMRVALLSVGIADIPEIVAVRSSGVEEDQRARVAVTPALGSDTDDSEQVRVLSVRGLPENGASFSEVIASESSFRGTVFTLSSTLSAGFRSYQIIAGLSVSPVLDCDIDLHLTVGVLSVESNGKDVAQTTSHFDVIVSAVADGAEMQAAATTMTSEDVSVFLYVTPNVLLQDTDLSESLHLLSVVGLPNSLREGIPTFSNLESSSSAYDGMIYTVSCHSFLGLSRTSFFPSYSIMPPRQCDVDLALTFRTFSVENNGKDRAMSSSTVEVKVVSAADVPFLFLSRASAVSEDAPLVLMVTPMVFGDTDGSEFATLNVLSPQWMSVLTYPALEPPFAASIYTPDECDADFTLTYSLSQTEKNGGSVGTSRTAKVAFQVLAVADDAILITNSSVVATTSESGVFQIIPSLQDTDGSETMPFISVTGDTDRMRLNSTSGHWSGMHPDLTLAFAPNFRPTGLDDMFSISVTPLVDEDVDFELTFSAVVVEANGLDTTYSMPAVVEVQGPMSDSATFVVDSSRLSMELAHGEFRVSVLDLFTEKSSPYPIEYDVVIASRSPWVSVYPISGVIPQNAGASILVYFNASDYSAGSYEDELEVSINSTQMSRHPVSMTVRQDSVLLYVSPSVVTASLAPETSGLSNIKLTNPTASEISLSLHTQASWCIVENKTLIIPGGRSEKTNLEVIYDSQLLTNMVYQTTVLISGSGFSTTVAVEVSTVAGPTYGPTSVLGIPNEGLVFVAGDSFKLVVQSFDAFGHARNVSSEGRFTLSDDRGIDEYSSNDLLDGSEEFTLSYTVAGNVSFSIVYDGLSLLQSPFVATIRPGNSSMGNLRVLASSTGDFCDSYQICDVAEVSESLVFQATQYDRYENELHPGDDGLLTISFEIFLADYFGYSLWDGDASSDGLIVLVATEAVEYGMTLYGNGEDEIPAPVYFAYLPGSPSAASSLVQVPFSGVVGAATEIIITLQDKYNNSAVLTEEVIQALNVWVSGPEALQTSDLVPIEIRADVLVGTFNVTVSGSYSISVTFNADPLGGDRYIDMKPSSVAPETTRLLRDGDECLSNIVCGPPVSPMDVVSIGVILSDEFGNELDPSSVEDIPCSFEFQSEVGLCVQENGNSTLVLRPQSAEVAVLSVFIQGVEVPGSGMFIEVVGSSSASQTLVWGSNQLCSTESACVSLGAATVGTIGLSYEDLFGNPVVEDEITAGMVAVASDASVAYAVVSPSQFELWSNETGDYVVFVEVGSLPVLGSPFLLTIQPSDMNPEASTVFALETLETIECGGSEMVCQSTSVDDDFQEYAVILRDSWGNEVFSPIASCLARLETSLDWTRAEFDEDSNYFKFSVASSVSGVWFLFVQVNGYNLTSSPFLTEFTPGSASSSASLIPACLNTADPCRRISVDEIPLEVVIEVRDQYGNPLPRDATALDVTVSVDDTSDQAVYAGSGTFVGRVVLTHTGSYLVSVRLGGDLISASDFGVEISAGEADPANTVIVPPGAVHVMSTTSIDLIVLDRFGNDVLVDTTGRFIVECDADTFVWFSEKWLHFVSVTPFEIEDLLVYVLLAGESVQGSPFSLAVTPGDVSAEHSIVLFGTNPCTPGLVCGDPFPVGTDAEFVVQLRDSLGYTYTRLPSDVSCQAEVDDVPIDLVDRGDGSLDLVLSNTVPSQRRVEVVCNGAPVQNSGFFVYTSDGDSSLSQDTLVFRGGVELCEFGKVCGDPVSVGTEVPFTMYMVDSSGMPLSESTGKLCTFSVGSSRSECIDQGGIYRALVSFTAAGDISVVVKIGQTTVSSSGFLLTVIPGSAVASMSVLKSSIGGSSCTIGEVCASVSNEVLASFFVSVVDRYGNDVPDGVKNVMGEALVSDPGVIANAVIANIIDWGDGTIAVSFNATLVASYDVYVWVSGDDVSNTPTMLVVGPGPPSHVTSSVTECDDISSLSVCQTLVAGENGTIVVQLRDVYGNAVVDSGVSQISYTFSPVSEEQDLNAGALTASGGTEVSGGVPLTLFSTLAAEYEVVVFVDGLSLSNPVLISVEHGDLDRSRTVVQMFVGESVNICENLSKCATVPTHESVWVKVFLQDQWANPFGMSPSNSAEVEVVWGLDVDVGGQTTDTLATVSEEESAFHVAVALSIAGEYTFSLSVNQIPMENSSYLVTAVPGTAYAGTTLLNETRLLSLQGTRVGSALVSMSFGDRYGNPTLVGEADLVVTIDGMEQAEKVITAARSLSNPNIVEFEVSFLRAGISTLNVFLDGENIGNSPQTVFVIPSDPSPETSLVYFGDTQCRQSVLCGCSWIPESEAVYDLHLLDAYGNVVSNTTDVTVHGLVYFLNGTDAYVEVVADPVFTVNLTMQFTVEDTYIVHVYVEGITVQNSGFYVLVRYPKLDEGVSPSMSSISPLNCTMCDCIPLATCARIAAGGEVQFSLQLRDSLGTVFTEPSNDLCIYVVESRSSAEQVVDLCLDQSDGTYLLPVSETIVGSYSVTVYLQTQVVGNSAFLVRVDPGPADLSLTVVSYIASDGSYSKCTSAGICGEATAGAPLQLAVEMRDTYGNYVNLENYESPGVWCAMDSKEVDQTGCVWMDAGILPEGAYLVSATLTVSALYSISVRVNNVDIPLIPLVSVNPSEAVADFSSVECQSSGCAYTVTAGTAVVVGLVGADEFSNNVDLDGSLTSFEVLSDTGVIDLTTIGSKLEILISEKGVHHVHVYRMGSEVGNSPVSFSINPGPVSQAHSYVIAAEGAICTPGSVCGNSSRAAEESVYDIRLVDSFLNDVDSARSIPISVIFTGSSMLEVTDASTVQMTLSHTIVGEYEVSLTIDGEAVTLSSGFFLDVSHASVPSATHSQLLGCDDISTVCQRTASAGDLTLIDMAAVDRYGNNVDFATTTVCDAYLWYQDQLVQKAVLHQEASGHYEVFYNLTTQASYAIHLYILDEAFPTQVSLVIKPAEPAPETTIVTRGADLCTPLWQCGNTLIPEESTALVLRLRDVYGNEGYDLSDVEITATYAVSTDLNGLAAAGRSSVPVVGGAYEVFFAESTYGSYLVAFEMDGVSVLQSSPTILTVGAVPPVVHTSVFIEASAASNESLTLLSLADTFASYFELPSAMLSIDSTCYANCSATNGTYGLSVEFMSETVSLPEAIQLEKSLIEVPNATLVFASSSRDFDYALAPPDFLFTYVDVESSTGVYPPLSTMQRDSSSLNQTSESVSVECVEGEDCSPDTRLHAGETEAYTLVLRDRYGNRLEIGLARACAWYLIPAEDTDASESAYRTHDCVDHLDGTFGVNIYYELSGAYMVAVEVTTVDGEVAEVGNSRFLIDIAPADHTNATASTVSGFPASMVAGDEARFIIEARDMFGNLRDVHGDNFTIVVNDADSESSVVPSSFAVWEEDTPGLYHASLTIETSDTLGVLVGLLESSQNPGVPGVPGVAGTMWLLLASQVVSVSPGAVSANASFARGTGVVRSVVGEPSEFTVVLRDRYYNQRLSASENIVVSFVAATGSFPWVLASAMPGEFTYQYLPSSSAAGSYSIVVEVEEGDLPAPIQGSPFAAYASCGLNSMHSLLNERICEDCPSPGAICDSVGLSHDTIKTEKDYWRPTSTSTGFDECFNTHAYVNNHREDGDFSDCRSSDLDSCHVCIGIDQWDYELGADGQCRRGYRSTLCSLCEEGYTRDSQFECTLCPSEAENDAAILGMVLLASLLVYFMVYTQLSVKTLENYHSAAVKMFTSHLQVVSFSRHLNLGWPQGVVDLFHAQASVSNPDPSTLSLECSFDPEENSFFQRVRLLTWLPFVVVACVTALFLGQYWYLLRVKARTDSPRRRSRRRGSQGPAATTLANDVPMGEGDDQLPAAVVPSPGRVANIPPPGFEEDCETGVSKRPLEELQLTPMQRAYGNWTVTLIMVFFLAYPTLTTQMLMVFTCQRLSDGKQYLVQSMDVECFSSEHWQIIPLAIFGLFVYGLGIPMLALFEIRRKAPFLFDDLEEGLSTVANTRANSIVSLPPPLPHLLDSSAPLSPVAPKGAVEGDDSPQTGRKRLVIPILNAAPVDETSSDEDAPLLIRGRRASQSSTRRNSVAIALEAATRRLSWLHPTRRLRIVGHADPILRRRFGFLCYGFKPQYYYWECFILFRKLLLLIVVVGMQTLSVQAQSVTLLGVLLANLGAHMLARPYLEDTLNRLETIGLSTSALTIYLGLLYRDEEIQASVSAVVFVSTLLILSNGLACMIFISVIGRYYYVSDTIVGILLRIIVPPVRRAANGVLIYTKTLLSHLTGGFLCRVSPSPAPSTTFSTTTARKGQNMSDDVASTPPDPDPPQGGGGSGAIEMASGVGHDSSTCPTLPPVLAESRDDGGGVGVPRTLGSPHSALGARASPDLTTEPSEPNKGGEVVSGAVGLLNLTRTYWDRRPLTQPPAPASASETSGSASGDNSQDPSRVRLAVLHNPTPSRKKQQLQPVQPIQSLQPV